jgi:hypothetical protein
MNIGGAEISKTYNSRKSKRIDYYSKIQCTKSIQRGETKEYEEPLELMLISVSVGGLSIISEEPFEKGTILIFNLKLEETLYEKVSANVIWTIKKGDMFRNGLGIMNISGKLYRHLSRLDNGITTRV